MLDMGLADYLITSTVNAIMAQRLVRVLCPACKVPHELDEEEISRMGIRQLVPAGQKMQLFKAEGCKDCSNTGYKGRMGIHELLVLNDEIRHLVLEHSSAEKIQLAARQAGMMTIYEDGMAKALGGFTSVEEVLRVAQIDVEL